MNPSTSLHSINHSSKPKSHPNDVIKQKKDSPNHTQTLLNINGSRQVRRKSSAGVLSPPTEFVPKIYFPSNLIIVKLFFFNLTSSQEVIIHVCDEIKGVSKDFKCPQKLLVSKMGYFADVTNGKICFKI
jgi:hypothetical protein